MAILPDLSAYPNYEEKRNLQNLNQKLELLQCDSHHEQAEELHNEANEIW